MPEECGVFGAFDLDGGSVAGKLYYGLYALQHRGQESCGIAISEGTHFQFQKGMGLVPDFFSNQSVFDKLGNGNQGVGHVRYSAGGGGGMQNVQPFVVHTHCGALALASNGSIVNIDVLRAKLEAEGHIMHTTTDPEIIATMIAGFGAKDMPQAVVETMMGVRGSYALVIGTEKQLIGVRDPAGIRPLAIGRAGNCWMLASESSAFDAVDAQFVRDVRPGEVVVIDQTGVRSLYLPVEASSHLCVFEFVYFARTDSYIDGISVYKAREDAGRMLAKVAPVEADLVCGVPDSATAAGIGYALGSGIPFGEGFSKNRYVGRTFIKPSQSMREEGVRVKLSALRQNVEGKRVVMVDDSIVRGTTSKKIVEMLRAAGAKEVHVRISSPPVRFPCYLGIDTPTTGELIGSNHSVNEIACVLGADSLAYLSLEQLLETVGSKNQTGFCKGCFDGKYPMDIKECRSYCPKNQRQ